MVRIAHCDEWLFNDVSSFCKACLNITESPLVGEFRAFRFATRAKGVDGALWPFDALDLCAPDWGAFGAFFLGTNQCVPIGVGVRTVRRQAFQWIHHEFATFQLDADTIQCSFSNLF